MVVMSLNNLKNGYDGLLTIIVDSNWIWMNLEYRNNSALGLVIRDFNSIIKMDRHIGDSLIIDVEYLVIYFNCQE